MIWSNKLLLLQERVPVRVSKVSHEIVSIDCKIRSKRFNIAVIITIWQKLESILRESGKFNQNRLEDIFKDAVAEDETLQPNSSTDVGLTSGT